MKSLARGLVWWPGIDKEIEKAAQSCKGCQESKQGPKLTQLHPWELPDGPWRRIHLDFAGPVEGKMLLIVVDAYSKWPEVVIMEDTTAESTVEEVRTMFSRWGLPAQMVTDNGCDGCRHQEQFNSIRMRGLRYKLRVILQFSQLELSEC